MGADWKEAPVKKTPKWHKAMPCKLVTYDGVALCSCGGWAANPKPSPGEAEEDAQRRVKQLHNIHRRRRR